MEWFCLEVSVQIVGIIDYRSACKNVIDRAEATGVFRQTHRADDNIHAIDYDIVRSDDFIASDVIRFLVADVSFL